VETGGGCKEECSEYLRGGTSSYFIGAPAFHSGDGAKDCKATRSAGCRPDHQKILRDYGRDEKMGKPEGLEESGGAVDSVCTGGHSHLTDYLNNLKCSRSYLYFL